MIRASLPPMFPELLTASACALPIFEIRHDPLESFGERNPVVVFIGDLHGPEPATEIPCLRAKPNGEMRQ